MRRVVEALGRGTLPGTSRDRPPRAPGAICQEAAAERRVCDGVRIVHESTMRSSHRRSGARILRSAPHLLQREADAMFLVPAPVAADGTGRFRVGSYRTVR